VIADGHLAPASRHDLALAEDLVADAHGWVLGDRSYWSPTRAGLLVERYHAKRVWARDAWHLWSPWQRKLLSHTLAVYLCQQTGRGSLRSPTSSPTSPHTGLATAEPTPERMISSG
jgi:hypothetical protein